MTFFRVIQYHHNIGGVHRNVSFLSIHTFVCSSAYICELICNSNRFEEMANGFLQNSKYLNCLERIVVVNSLVYVHSFITCLSL